MEEYRSNYEAIIFRPLRLIQLLSPSLVNTAARPGRGRMVILNIGTASRQTPIPWTGQYFHANVRLFFLPRSSCLIIGVCSGCARRALRDAEA